MLLINKKNYVDVWLLKENINTKDIKFIDGEVQDVKWVSIDEWVNMLKEGITIKSSTDYLLNYINKNY